MAYHKLNRFHWHLCDDQGWRFAVPGYPLLIEVGSKRLSDGHCGFYTDDDIRRVVVHADKLGIVVVPEIELPGHAMAALASYPHLGCRRSVRNVPSEWGIYQDVYCAGRDETFTFLADVLCHISSLFQQLPLIHIGGDEVPKDRWKSCTDCQKRMHQEGLNSEDELQSWFIRRIAAILEQRGVSIIGWDEILEGIA